MRNWSNIKITKMKIYKSMFVGLLGLCLVVSCTTKSKTVSTANTQIQNQSSTMDSVSYSVGVIVAQNLKEQGFNKLNGADMAKAIEDIMNDAPLAISKEDAEQTFRNEIHQNQTKMMEGNKAAGEAFLAANSKKEGVVTLPSGLQYKVIKEGDGPKPTVNDKVKTHYHGMLIDGRVFDSSVDRGEPISFSLGQVIKAWQEGIPLMTVGSKYVLYAPYDLAYGERAAGQLIQPYSTLIFEVELLGIE